MYITKSKNGFADYPGIPRTDSHELMRTPEFHRRLETFVYKINDKTRKIKDLKVFFCVIERQKHARLKLWKVLFVKGVN